MGEAGQIKGCLDVLVRGERHGFPAWRKSLNGLEFLAALTPYFTEDLAEKAQVLIPKPTWLEADGTYTFSDGSGTRFKKRVLKPPDGVSPAAKDPGRPGRPLEMN